jgi:TRAP-type C4-dicarboxylate transport system permease small subunit
METTRIRPGSGLFKTFERATGLLSYILFAVAMALVACLMFLTAVDVIGRFFGRPIIGSYQMSELMQVWIVCLSWPYAARVMAHVRVDMIVEKLPKHMQRNIDILMHLIVLAIFGLISWQGVELVMRTSAMGELVGIINVPLSPFQIVVPLGAFATILVLVAQLPGLLAPERNRKEGER